MSKSEDAALLAGVARLFHAASGVPDVEEVVEVVEVSTLEPANDEGEGPEDDPPPTGGGMALTPPESASDQFEQMLARLECEQDREAYSIVRERFAQQDFRLFCSLAANLARELEKQEKAKKALQAKQAGEVSHD